MPSVKETYEKMLAGMDLQQLLAGWLKDDEYKHTFVRVDLRQEQPKLKRRN